MIRVWGAVAIFAASALTLGLQLPGLQYDEALMVLGSVQMLRSAEILPLPQDPDTWQCVWGRCFPLMTVRYVGALKEYLTLPAMALFGFGPEVIRVVSVLWASIAVWGLARFAGLGAALVLAVNPSFADMTAFDNGAVAGWSGALGLVLISMARYRESPGIGRALWAGAAVGLAVWARANFLWLIAGGAIGWAGPLIAWVRSRPREAASAAAGALLGSVPFLIYQVVSRGGTFEAAGMFRAQGTWTELLTARLRMFAEALISNREHRAIWDGPPMPEWQVWFWALAAVAALASCLMQGGMPRRLAMTALVFHAFLFASSLPVAEHHFVPALPLLAAVAAVAFPRKVAMPLGVLYLAACGWWQWSAIRGVHATGGTGQWSDAIVSVRDHLRSHHPGREVRILDWGLGNNLWVLSGGSARIREDFEGPWEAKIANGGLFLTNAPGGTFFAIPNTAFREALAASGAGAVPVEFRERGGRLFAELWDLRPAVPPSARAAAKPWVLDLKHVAAETRLNGFYQVDEGRFRWTMRRFSVTVPRPAGEARIAAEIYLPPEVLARSGPVTLSIEAGGVPLESERLATAGSRAIVRKLPPGPAGEVTIRFALDKYIPPSPADRRELGIVAEAFSVTPGP